MHQEDVSSDDLKVVETVPGWQHTITNVGEQELICILWCNEIFDEKTLTHTILISAEAS